MLGLTNKLFTGLNIMATAAVSSPPVSASATQVQIGSHTYSIEWLVFIASIIFFGVNFIIWAYSTWKEHVKWKVAVGNFYNSVNTPVRQFLLSQGADTATYDESVQKMIKSIYKNHRALEAYAQTITSICSAVHVAESGQNLNKEASTNAQMPVIH